MAESERERPKDSCHFNVERLHLGSESLFEGWSEFSARSLMFIEVGGGIYLKSFSEAYISYAYLSHV